MQLASRAVLLSAMVRVQAWAAGGGNAGVADMQPSLSCPAHRAQTHMQHFQHASNRTASRQINLYAFLNEPGKHANIIVQMYNS
mmetsp:Transcript_28818/g.85298  ORF Transcript_28818/g.85298 Transcript_28818/m.85298 type:complete len:84 (+) Transcript_28818:2732-2983(+)